MQREAEMECAQQGDAPECIHAPSGEGERGGCDQNGGHGGRRDAECELRGLQAPLSPRAHQGDDCRRLAWLNLGKVEPEVGGRNETAAGESTAGDAGRGTGRPRWAMRRSRGEQKRGDKNGPHGEKQGQRVPFFALFSYADSWDVVLMLLGALGACIHGAALPLFFLAFGNLLNSLATADLSSANQVRLEQLPAAVGRASMLAPRPAEEGLLLACSCFTR